MLGRVVRPGSQGIPQRTLLGILLALLLLVAILATTLVYNYRWKKKQQGELVTSTVIQSLSQLW